MALGQGWRLGFLGMLHLDVFRQRLEEEYDTNVIVTSPTVTYRGRFLLSNRNEFNYSIISHGFFFLLVVDIKNKEYYVKTPTEFPEPNTYCNFYEPMVLANFIFPKEYLGPIIELCQVNFYLADGSKRSFDLS
jgi:translation elongation factor EF-4